MPRENKILRMFRLLTEDYEVKVVKTGILKKEARILKVTLTVHGVRYMFHSEDDDFRMFIVTLAREEMGEAFSSSNIRDLNLQLESIASAMETVSSREKGCGCGCVVAESVDDE
jgi:hypothetical protein